MSKSMKKALQNQMKKVNNNFTQADKQLANCKNKKCIPTKTLNKQAFRINKLITENCGTKFNMKYLKCKKPLYENSEFKKLFIESEDCKAKKCSKEIKNFVKTLNEMYTKKRSLDKQYEKSMKKTMMTNNKTKKRLVILNGGSAQKINPGYKKILYPGGIKPEYTNPKQASQKIQKVLANIEHIEGKTKTIDHLKPYGYLYNSKQEQYEAQKQFQLSRLENVIRRTAKFSSNPTVKPTPAYLRILINKALEKINTDAQKLLTPVPIPSNAIKPFYDVGNANDSIYATVQ
jgi:hypothetical protein